jgi:hypothetical protein
MSANEPTNPNHELSNNQIPHASLEIERVDVTNEATAIERLIMEKAGISLTEAREKRQSASESVLTRAATKNNGPRANAQAIEAAMPEFRANGFKEVSARVMTEYLFKAGLIDHENPRAIGDALGQHKGGLGLRSRKHGGVKVYLLPEVSTGSSNQ